MVFLAMLALKSNVSAFQTDAIRIYCKHSIRLATALKNRQTAVFKKIYLERYDQNEKCAQA
jgi:hypothetical protein